MDGVVATAPSIFLSKNKRAPQVRGVRNKPPMPQKKEEIEGADPLSPHII
ncbi:hypothetical protein KDA_12340 [Dictyobacter alpinus]|uniref:Uncharacterized protein n=1 Tax=Dictyobacter alpinus TaxID=2014873 RepID=A0A402B312_9CHLR|nr:hypothetical protein KDA_12340 [Dictyobacter alpinus]